MNFVSVDRDTPMLLPMDLRDWVKEDHIVNFILEAAEAVDLSRFKVKQTAAGKAQYPPHMMLALLIYCYALGLVSSRKIEEATRRDIYVRFLTANTHPDHDTICTFRRENLEAFKECFFQVLQLAKELKLLKVGTIAVDGTHIKANASKDKNVTYDRAGELEAQLKQDIEDLIKKAEQADNEPTAEEGLPKEIQRRETLKAKMQEAKAELEKRAKDRARAEKPKFEAKQAKHEERGGRGRPPAPPKEDPEPKEQYNLSDGDSRVMRKHKQGTQQCYNGQISVDAEGSQLILSQHISQCSADTNELEVAIKGIPQELGVPEKVLADSGYCKIETITHLEAEGMDPFISPINEATQNQRNYDYRPQERTQKASRKLVDPVLVKMRDKLASEEGRATYSKRQCSVEPVFGIIKQAMGFRQFMLRGLEKVEGEWNLVCLAYNVKRLFNLKQRAKA